MFPQIGKFSAANPKNRRFVLFHSRLINRIYVEKKQIEEITFNAALIELLFWTLRDGQQLVSQCFASSP